MILLAPPPPPNPLWGWDRSRKIPLALTFSLDIMLWPEVLTVLLQGFVFRFFQTTWILTSGRKSAGMVKMSMILAVSASSVDFVGVAPFGACSRCESMYTRVMPAELLAGSEHLVTVFFGA